MGRARRTKAERSAEAPAAPAGGGVPQWLIAVVAFAVGLGAVAVVVRRDQTPPPTSPPRPTPGRSAADVRPQLDRARALIETHQLSAAQTVLTEAAAAAPHDAEVAFMQGDVAYRSLKMEAAEVHYRRAAELAPQSAGAHANLALVLMQMGQARAAAEAARRAVGLEPGDPAMQAVLGQALLRDGKAREAIEQLEPALARGARGAESHAALGRARDLVGRTEEALRAFDDAEREDPQLPLVHFWRAECLARAGRTKDAEQARARSRAAEKLISRLANLQLKVQNEPDDVEAWLDLARAQLDRGAGAEALVSLRRAGQIAPNHPEVRRVQEALAAARRSPP
jgi:cytochrome c-type biogenesis protein CcmH/NrfG